jgi:hypothetical protein
MAKPPRLPAIRLPWENSIVYFVTICTLRKHRDAQPWEWQRGCFDRLLRSDENLRSKWIYVKDNPVRHGFVQRAEDWPYYLDFINEPDAGSCQLPLQNHRVQFSGVGAR